MEPIIKNERSMYRVADWSLTPGTKKIYPAERSGAQMLKEWLVGIPVKDQERDDSGYLQRGKGYQALSIEKIFRSEARSEMRKPMKQFKEEIEKGFVTFVRFKSDALVRDPKTQKFIFQEMLEELQRKGFEIAARGVPTEFTEKEARDFYAVHQGQWFYEPSVIYAREVSIPALLRYRKGHAVEELRKILPELREQFGVVKGDEGKGIVSKNKIHASDSIPNVFREGNIAFRSEMREDASVAKARNQWPAHEAQKIAVIGTGFVGATKAILLVTDWGHDVIGVDVKPEIVEKLSRGKLTFHADDLQKLLNEGLATGRLAFTTDYAKAIDGREIIFLSVQTPQSETGHANIDYLKDSVRRIAQLVKAGESKIIIGKSTAPPRDTVAMLKQVVQEEFQKREAAGEDLRGAAIHFAWEPEFLREGKEVEDDRGVAGRIVIGADDRTIAERVQSLYAHANPDPEHARTQVPVVMTDLISAPLVKYAANGYRGMKISFINFVSWLTEALGFNIDDIADAIGSDVRIRRSFLSAGLGFGGSCFPKDLAAFVQIARQNHVLPGLVLDALAVNELQWQLFLEKVIIPQLRSVQHKTITVLGASFKPGKDDIRESRSVKIIEKLLARGARIRVYDPVAIPRLNDPVNGPFKNDTEIEYFSDPARLQIALEGSDAVILATEWPDFGRIDFEGLKQWFGDHQKELPPIFDGRNFFSREKLETLRYPYFNIGHGEKQAIPKTDRAEFIEDVREFFLALRISYINMIAEVAERIGANIRDVKRGLGLDPVVGEDYLAPGIGWGGNNLITALDALEKHAEQYLPEPLREFWRIRREIQEKFEFGPEASQDEKAPVPFIATVKKINDAQISLYLEKAREAVGGDLRGKVVAVLGLAYKPGEYVTYKSRSLNLIEALLNEGATVRATDADPQSIMNAKRDLQERHIAFSENLLFIFGNATAQDNARETVRGSDLQVLVTASAAFADVREVFFNSLEKPVARRSRVVDGRHFYDPKQLYEKGIEYFSVGIPSKKISRSEVRGVDASSQTRSDGLPGLSEALAKSNHHDATRRRQNSRKMKSSAQRGYAQNLEFSDWEGMPRPGRRSELRNLSTLIAVGVPVKTPVEFFARNQEKGGGSEAASRALTTKVMDEIISLFAYTLNAAELLIPAVTRMPAVQEVHSKAAKRVLGLAPNISYAFVLGPDLALRKGMIEMAKTILKDSAFAILVKNDPVMVAKAEALIKQEGLEGRVFVITDVKLAKARISKPGAALRGMISSDELLLAEEFKEELKDDLIVMDKGMQQRFLNAAGQLFQSLAEKIAAQFSLSRSA
ncbi:MAG: nucleotide sugar dehydrogenase [Candidatus Omnitrophica bacterium]|nr:nucleotide sugar dehydrogenase [Candidatus Omnitrophota bacterium]